MSTFSSLHVHVTFSTKFRKPWINPDWEDRLHAYLGGILKKLDVVPHQIGGVDDHVHLLFGFKTSHCVSHLLRELKKSSSAWVHDEIRQPAFQWQDGYAVFSVSATALDPVRRYIIGQREHHRGRTFQEELDSLLRRAGIHFDPNHLD